MQNYGVDSPMKSPVIRARLWENYKNKTGYDHPSHNPEVRSKSAKALKQSKLETKVKTLLDEYKIEYIHHYLMEEKNHYFLLFQVI